MNQGWMARGLVAAVVALASAEGMTSCDLGSDASTPGTDGVDSGPAANVDIDRSCKHTSDCSSNTECLYANASDPQGICTIPTGTCTGPDDALEFTGSCYFGSRCQISPGSTSGECTFTPASHQAFVSATGIITLDSPTATTPLSATNAFTLQWEPPTGQPVGAITVAVVTRAVPVLDPATNEITNPSDIVWIWSSASPGGDVQQGAVPVSNGAHGLGPTGDLSAQRWGTDSLPNGVYFWFVYEISDGSVVSSSLVQRFRVGPDENPAQSCTAASDCVQVGYAPETAACIATQCMQRCASNIDCPAVGSHCDLASPLNDGADWSDIHSGFCSTDSSTPSTDDAGADSDAAPPDGF